MFEWSMSSIKVWMSVYFLFLANSLFLPALKTFVSLLSKKSISHEHLILDISYQQQVFPLFHNIRFSSHFFVTFESIRKLYSLQYNPIPHFNCFSPTSDLDRISPYTISKISTISSRWVMRIKKNIN